MEDHGHAPGWAVWLEATGLGEVARNSLWLYPIVSVAHVLGIAMLIGSIIAFDLRVLGFGRAIPLPAAAKLLLPLARTGFAIAVLSGTVMLAADATHVVTNPAFLVKATLLGLALANIALFHLIALPDTAAPVSGLARASALVSAILWLTVATAGRSIAYF